MENAFQILVQEYHEMVFACLLALVNDSHLAEDLTQEAFVVAYRRMGDFDKTRDFGSWVRGIARHIAMAEQRRSKRIRFVQIEKVQHMISDAFYQAGGPAPSLWRRRMEALRSCLAKADERLRKILDLHYGKKMKAEHIAEQLGVRIEAVWKRLSRGRHVLRDCIERRLGQDGASV